MSNPPIIEIKNISKKYNIKHQQGGYVALRDVLTNIAKSPFKFLYHKTKEAVGKTTNEEFWALKDISFNIEKGDTIGIIGHNGAGKSTLLKILTGITPPTTGEIKMRGRVASLLEVGTGFHPELTGRENIFLNGAILGMTKKEISEKFDEIVEFSGISKFLDTPVKRYSSGMYVRLAFSVAAHMEPDILLVDEVLAVGDAEFQKKCLGKMDEVTKKAGRTIIFVSHNMEAIRNLCNKCVLLKEGEITMFGNTNEIIQKYLNNKNKKENVFLNTKINRKGNGNIQFSNVEITNNQGSKIIKSGDKIIIKLSYNNNLSEEVKNIRIMITFRNQYDIPVLRLDTQVSENSFDTLKQTGEIICSTDNINLIEGSYSANLLLMKNEKWEDFIQDAFTLKLENNNKIYRHKIDADQKLNIINVSYDFKNITT